MTETRSNHTVYNINYHYVWTPKYRHNILDKVEENLEEWIQKIAKNNDYKIISLHISPDHINLFLSTHPKHSPSKIISRIKSITARKLWKHHEKLMKNISGMVDVGKPLTTSEQQEK